MHTDIPVHPVLPGMSEDIPTSTHDDVNMLDVYPSTSSCTYSLTSPPLYPSSSTYPLILFPDYPSTTLSTYSLTPPAMTIKETRKRANSQGKLDY